MSDRRGLILAVAAFAVATVVLLASTGPRPSEEASGPIRRLGGACLHLERWSLFGWASVGQTHGVDDLRDGVWHDVMESPPCDPEIAEQTYLIRLPAHASTGSYRICGLADEEPCLEFRRVGFIPGPPGP
jgi:hypothetical protein